MGKPITPRRPAIPCPIGCVMSRWADSSYRLYSQSTILLRTSPMLNRIKSPVLHVLNAALSPQRSAEASASEITNIKFLSALQTNLVRPLLNSEHTTHLAMMTSEGKLKNPQQESHKFCARCRRSQLPLASSQPSSVRTLVRARAIEQSAAP